MDDGVQVLQPAFGKGELGEASTVEPAVGADYSGAEGADDVVVNLVARFHELASQFVGFDHLGAEGAELRGNGGFAAAETAGETDPQHGRPPRESEIT